MSPTRKTMPMRRLALFVTLCISALAVALSTALPAQAIIGGQDAANPYSFMVSLQNEVDGHFCGGSLITPTWVVTAAHCIRGDEPADVDLRIGSLDTDSGGETRGVSQIVPHPAGEETYDIALLKLDQPASGVPIGIGTRPAEGSPTRLIGWGCTTPTMGLPCSPPDVLQELDSQIRSSTVCASGAGPIDPVWEVCTGNPDTKAGPCRGDSGGPLLAPSGDTWLLIGAFNRMALYCDQGPGIYADVPAHRPWIESITGPLP
ncbi:hypothetical protein C1I98_08575 [Spongiactinospora gelatinilytica]|uniref:Peptidase S1 domain-containing protein n=2 Tax=Spongiactinospora gelatinilytica TaxID=2666298 RepID=A0A2W2HZS3_9ACTN|nr:hypothetical protein C1I98_08575 [Spongiactinospora gelatinilytica]